MKIKIRKITKKSWFYFLSVGGIASLFFARVFLGGTNIVNLAQLESSAKNVLIQTGIVNVALADTAGGDSDSGSSGDCDTDGCGDGSSY